MTLDHDMMALLKHGAAVVRVAKHDKQPLGKKTIAEAINLSLAP